MATAEKKIRILVSVPNWMSTVTYIPYIWGCLKSACDLDPILKYSTEWLTPIFHTNSAEVLLQNYDLEKIDVFAISGYEWNWPLQLEMAQKIKKKNPHCLVVAGGPQPDWRSPQEDLKFIDLIVKKDGEDVFPEILRWQLGEKELTQIPNLILKDGTHTKEEKNASFTSRPSAYLSNRPHFEYWIQKLRQENTKIYAMLETNRGCPYSCSFCDWGSATMGKIRPFDYQKTKAEIDWLGEQQVEVVFITDANFGIFSQDLEIARWIVEAKQKYGYPKRILWNAAKNNMDRVIEIGKIWHQHALIDCVPISFQHTEDAVLESIQRKNIKTENLRYAVEEFDRLKVPTMGVLIAGNPGDTYTHWKKAWANMMEWGFHEDIQTHLFALLPNAPAKDPAYLEKWGIQSMRRPAARSRVFKNAQDLHHYHSNTSEYICETNTLTKEDFIQCLYYADFCKALHNLGLLRFVSQYLRFSHQIPYGEFYESLVENLESHGEFFAFLQKEILQSKQSFLYKENSSILMDPGPEFDFYCQPEEWIYYTSLKNQVRFYKDVRRFLGAYHPSIPQEILDDLLLFQTKMLISPDYDPKHGRIISCKYDWPKYFKTQGSILSEAVSPILINENKTGSSLLVDLHFSGEQDFFWKIIKPHNLRSYQTYFWQKIQDQPATV